MLVAAPPRGSAWAPRRSREGDRLLSPHVEPLQATDPERIGRFVLRGRLGVGGMGRVYLGVTPQGVEAAVKVIRDELTDDPEFRQRFRREVAAAAAVSGMFTARVLDADPDGSPPWLATQYVGGPALRSAVLTNGPLSPPAQHRLARELAEALSAIHAAGLVHRDLKPANVLLSPAGAKVIDFGIAQAMDSTRLTSTGMIIGTPDYMAPEQVTDPNGSGPAADVFAMGATLVYAATGNSPFGAGQAASTLYRVVNLEPDLRGVPPDTARIARACLAKDPAQRPTSAALAAALRGGPSGTMALTALTMNLTGPQPTATAALPHPGPGPLRPDRRRAPWVIGVAGVVVALVTASLIGMARQGSGGVGSPATSSPVALSTAPATPASIADPDTPQARYVARLCNSGGLLKSLGDSAATPPVSGDAAENRRNFLVQVDRVVGVTDVALADFTVLRDDAPTTEVKRLFGLIVDEFTAARGSFVKARDVVGRSDPLTIGAFTTGNARFADGVRNMSYAAQLLQQVKLPDDYTDEGRATPAAAADLPARRPRVSP